MSRNSDAKERILREKNSEELQAISRASGYPVETVHLAQAILRERGETPGPQTYAEPPPPDREGLSRLLNALMVVALLGGAWLYATNSPKPLNLFQQGLLMYGLYHFGSRTRRRS